MPATASPSSRATRPSTSSSRLGAARARARARARRRRGGAMRSVPPRLSHPRPNFGAPTVATRRRMPPTSATTDLRGTHRRHPTPPAPNLRDGGQGKGAARQSNAVGVATPSHGRPAPAPPRHCATPGAPPGRPVSQADAPPRGLCVRPHTTRRSAQTHDGQTAVDVGAVHWGATRAFPRTTLVASRSGSDNRHPT